MPQIYRGLVKWYDRGLQNLWRGFDSLIPWFKKEAPETLLTARIQVLL